MGSRSTRTCRPATINPSNSSSPARSNRSPLEIACIRSHAGITQAGASGNNVGTRGGVANCSRHGPSFAEPSRCKDQTPTDEHRSTAAPTTQYNGFMNRAPSHDSSQPNHEYRGCCIVQPTCSQNASQSLVLGLPPGKPPEQHEKQSSLFVTAGTDQGAQFAWPQIHPGPVALAQTSVLESPKQDAAGNQQGPLIQSALGFQRARLHQWISFLNAVLQFHFTLQASTVKAVCG